MGITCATLVRWRGKRGRGCGGCKMGGRREFSAQAPASSTLLGAAVLQADRCAVLHGIPVPRICDQPDAGSWASCPLQRLRMACSAAGQVTRRKRRTPRAAADRARNQKLLELVAWASRVPLWCAGAVSVGVAAGDARWVAAASFRHRHLRRAHS